MKESGLYVVATPIGNLEDISFRAVRILDEADLVAAEDTRRASQLFTHYNLATPLISLHEHNETRKLDKVLERVEQGQAVALISDAGTPLISDPGFRLVQAARERNLPVHVVPGPSAVTAALSVAGLPTDRFTFEGFLPSKAGARKKRLEALSAESRTMVFFESSHRIAGSLIAMSSGLGPARRASVCRELTKRFETVLTGTLEELAVTVEEEENQRKGEFVVVVEGADSKDNLTGEQGAAVMLAAALLEYMPASQAARVAAKVTGVPRREIYNSLGS